MEPVLKVLNRLEKEGIFRRYAIGGAAALIFYIEPILTYDLDVFIMIERTSAGLYNLTPIYERLSELGYKTFVKEYIIIEGVPVQFLPPYNPLTEEAVKRAKRAKVGRTPTQVFRLEHLIAIMLQTGRRKDRERLALFLEEAKISLKDLKAILARHGLQKKWQEFHRGSS